MEEATRQAVCVVCKSTDFEDTDDGALACVECGTLLHGVRQEIHEAGAAQPLGASLIRRRVFRQQSSVAEYPPGSFVTAAEAFEAFQRVLQKLLVALVESCGLDARLPLEVGRLWIETVALFPAVGSDGARTERLTRVPTVTLQGRTGARGQGALRGESLVLSTPLLLSLCYLGCVNLQLAVLPHDLVAWCQSGELPFLTAYRTLPDSMQNVVAANGMSPPMHVHMYMHTWAYMDTRTYGHIHIGAHVQAPSTAASSR